MKYLISSAEAESIIMEFTHKSHTFRKSYKNPTDECLKEDICADRDFPPYHRVAMDGYAVNLNGVEVEDLCTGKVGFDIVDVSARAGVQAVHVQEGLFAVEVMTGAVLPIGCNCVIPVENAQIRNNKVFFICAHPPKTMQNIHQRGSDSKKGDILVKSGQALTPAQWAVAVSCGATNVQVAAKPKISILSTGDELIDPDETPNEYQIRISNPFAIHSALVQSGFSDVRMFHAPDNEHALKNTVGRALENSEYLITSGGVSMGRFDLLPEVFRSLGVKGKFHKIQQKPGKPFWFGVGRDQQLVFGLPGNPVSILVNCFKYVLTSLKYRQTGRLEVRPYACLTENVCFKKPFQYFLPVKVNFSNNGFIFATPVNITGSGDVSNLGQADGFLELPSNKNDFMAGEAYPLYIWKDIR